MLRLGRLLELSPSAGHGSQHGTHARFPLDDLKKCIEDIIAVATIIDERVRSDIELLGLNPEDSVNETDIDPQICDLAFCRNTLEEVHDELASVAERRVMTPPRVAIAFGIEALPPRASNDN